MSTKPIIELDTAGSATVVSYDLPEATSYSGRHYIELALNSTDFREEVPATAQQPLKPRPTTGVGSGLIQSPPENESSTDLGVSGGVIFASGGPNGSVDIRPPRQLSPGLAE